MNPMTPLTLEQLRDLAPLYVLGMLDADEQAAFDRGLQNPEFRDTLERDLITHRTAIEQLAVAQPVAPPPNLKARMMERIAAEKRADIPVVPAPVDDLAARRSMRTARWTAGVLATALAASLMVMVDLRNQAKALSDRVATNESQVASAEAKLAERDRTLQTLLAGRGNVVLVTLNPAAPAGPGMQVFWNVREGKAVVNAYGLAPVPSDRAYMLWMIRDGKPVPLKLFTPGSDGRAIVASVELPTTTSGVTLLAVTEESSAGAEAPTMTPFLVGAVPAKGAAQ